jgi:hypothetical protein
MSVMIDLSVPLDYFAKRAKELQSRVRAGDADACNRVRRVFTDASAKSDSELAEHLGLMRAQHIIAVEHSFANWKALTDSSGIEARLAITMARHPELNDFGIGLYGGDKNKSDAEKDAINAENRRVLRASAAAVATTVTWLRENVEPTRTINKRHTSYGLKHMAEKDIGYITNGVFIAAGIIAEYPYEISDSANVPFGMSEKSLKEVSARRTSPERLLKRFTPRAIEVLAKRGVQAFPVGRSGVEVAWLDDGDVRTLRIGTIERSPFIVRIFVDHYVLIVSRKVAKALGVSGAMYPADAPAHPSRPKGEISILLDEVEPALEWALNHDARADAQPPPPPFEVSGSEAWSYVWSKRASDRYAARRRRSEAV